MAESAAKPSICAIIVAGGTGSRMGGDRPKQFLLLGGKPILFHSISVFDQHPLVTHLCVVLDESLRGRYGATEFWPLLRKPLVFATPGAERADSVRAALIRIGNDIDFVLIHDAARPLVQPQMIDATLAAARQTGAAIVARPVTETVKRVGEQGITETVDRRELWIAETPQAFAYELIARAHQHAADNGLSLTDDAQAVEMLNHPIAVCSGFTSNPKITVPEDLLLAKILISQRAPSVKP